MMKKIFSTMLIFLLAFQIFANGKKDKNQTQKTETSLKVVASTSWTAAFADLAGLENIELVAPANLRHPPEYEITPSDIQKIFDCDIFIYTGFERMMQTLGKKVGNAIMIQIDCDNSIETVQKSTQKIAEITGTQKLRDERVAKYVSFIKDAANQIEQKGLKGAKVYVNKNQRFLAKELGFDIAQTFGPEAVTATQIQTAKDENFIFIIDNMHNPVGEPLAEVATNSKYILWRNFPECVEQDTLLHVVQQNVNALEK